MTRSLFQFEQSPWWIILLLLVSAALSYFLYVKKNVPWTPFQNWVLLGLRALGIFLILLLLLDPSIKKIINRLEKPIIALAIDNSQSVVARGTDSLQLKNDIQSLTSYLEDEDFEVKTISFSSSDSLQFKEKTTRISGLLSKVEEATDKENLVGIVLLSDGIYNRGSSPLYRNYLHPIFTVGLGDTIPPKDISISRTRYNRVTYKGNETPIRLEISQQGYNNLDTRIQLSENGKLIEEKSLRLNKSVQEVEFSVASEDEGLRHLKVTIPHNAAESTEENNAVDIFLEVIDGRQKVLVVAGAPHPDIKAIRSSLEETDNYETDLYIPSIDENAPKEIYDVVIYHGAYNNEKIYQPLEQPGKWYILNSESAVSLVNKNLNYISIERRSSQPDKVSGSFNPTFSKFKIDDTEIFEEYPPIEVPFGDYTVSGASEILMYQKLGNIVTKKPLMVINDNGSSKSALLMGQNIWRWKLQEAAINENTEQFDNFITKTIQFLSVKNDKKQFRFDTRKSIFSNSQPIVFDSEVYNEIYERIYGNQVSIAITDEEGISSAYDFMDSESNTTFRAPSLAPGIYSYNATVDIGEKTFTEQGEFLVENVNTEYLNLTADHRLLRNLATKTNGAFIHQSAINQLRDIIENQNFKPIMKSEEDVQSLRQSFWYFLTIFLLFSAEWILRRYWGGY